MCAWKPTQADYLDALGQQNPWHQSGHLPGAFAYASRRFLTQHLWRSLIDRPGGRFQVVLGPRRVGKTVGMFQTIEQMLEHEVPARRLWFMRMDHPLFHDYPLGGWVKALVQRERPSSAEPLYLFLDEVNYADRWDLWLKTFHDERWPVHVVATSSSVAALRDRHIESGVGRWSEQFMMPYSFAEYCDLLDVQRPFTDLVSSAALSETIQSFRDGDTDTQHLRDDRRAVTLVGGFPEILLGGPTPSDDIESSILRSQQILRSEAIQRVAGMDLPQTFQIRQPIILERLLYLLAGQMCGRVTVSTLAETLGVTRPTINQYIDYLERAFLIFTLPAYSGSEESVQRKARKVYFVDGAIRNAALQRGLAPIHDPREIGALSENVVASHLFALSVQRGARLYHWRSGKHEVDFVFEDPTGPVAFEVTASSQHSLRGLRAFRERHPAVPCYLVSASPAFHLPNEDEEGIGRVPFETFLLAIGSTAERALEARIQHTSC